MTLTPIVAQTLATRRRRPPVTVKTPMNRGAGRKEIAPTAAVGTRIVHPHLVTSQMKKKMQREAIFREMRLRKHYEKPSEKKVREKGRSHSARSQEHAARGSFPDEASGDLRDLGEPPLAVLVVPCAA
jgi:ribosomal protein S21